MGGDRRERRSSESMATKEATEIEEEAAAKAPIKEEAAAKALEKKGQEEELKTRGWRIVKGFHIFSLSFENLFKKFSIKNERKIKFKLKFKK